MLPAARAILHELQAARVIAAVFLRRIVAVFALRARQGNNWANILFGSHNDPLTGLLAAAHRSFTPRSW